MNKGATAADPLEDLLVTKEIIQDSRILWLRVCINEALTIVEGTEVVEATKVAAFSACLNYIISHTLPEYSSPKTN